MTEAAIYEQLTPIFRDIFDDDSIVLTPETSASEIPEWDSLNHITLVVAQESKFGVKFKSAELEELLNVGGLVALIQKKLAAQGR